MNDPTKKTSYDPKDPPTCHSCKKKIQYRLYNCSECKENYCYDCIQEYKCCNHRKNHIYEAYDLEVVRVG